MHPPQNSLQLNTLTPPRITTAELNSTLPFSTHTNTHTPLSPQPPTISYASLQPPFPPVCSFADRTILLFKSLRILLLAHIQCHWYQKSVKVPPHRARADADANLLIIRNPESNLKNRQALISSSPSPALMIAKILAYICARSIDVHTYMYICDNTIVCMCVCMYE